MGNRESQRVGRKRRDRDNVGKREEERVWDRERGEIGRVGERQKKYKERESERGGGGEREQVGTERDGEGRRERARPREREKQKQKQSEGILSNGFEVNSDIEHRQKHQPFLHKRIPRTLNETYDNLAK